MLGLQGVGDFSRRVLFNWPYSLRFADANAIGNISSFAAVSWACALQIMAGAMIGSGFMFQPTMAQTLWARYAYFDSCIRLDILTDTTRSGVYCGLVLLQGITCSLGSAALARLQTPAYMLNILSVKNIFGIQYAILTNRDRLWVVLLIALPVATSPGLNNVKFVFGTFTNGE